MTLTLSPILGLRPKHKHPIDLACSFQYVGPKIENCLYTIRDWRVDIRGTMGVMGILAATNDPMFDVFHDVHY